MYLLDTNVLSELRKIKPHGAVLAWLDSVPSRELFVPSVVLGEIQRGVEITREHQPAKALEIEAWLDVSRRTYAVLDANTDIFRQWARFMHKKSPAYSHDALIAATAWVYGLRVVTRNVKDFSGFGVPLLNPFELPEHQA